MLLDKKGLMVPDSPLILVQNDEERFAVVRRGRFALAREAAESELHRDAAIQRALKSFIPQMEAEGFRYLGLVMDDQEHLSDDPSSPYFGVPNPNHGKPKIQILEHVESSDDMSPDPGRVPLPPPPGSGATFEQLRNYARVCLEHEKAAKKLVAQDATDPRDLVDIRVFVKFSAPKSKTWRQAAPRSR